MYASSKARRSGASGGGGGGGTEATVAAVAAEVTVAAVAVAVVVGMRKQVCVFWGVQWAYVHVCAPALAGTHICTGRHTHMHWQAYTHAKMWTHSLPLAKEREIEF